MKKNLLNKKKDIREETHITRPPRMEGRVKNTKMNSVKKAKKTLPYSLPAVEPTYLVGEDGYEEYNDEYEYNEEYKY